MAAKTHTPLASAIRDALDDVDAPMLNGLMARGAATWSALRLALSRALRAGADEQGDLTPCLFDQSDVEYAVPARIGDYTDFYASVHHATNIGRLFRPDNPLLPNYKWVPIGYHGRSSTIGVSGTDFHRPKGQMLPPGASEPVFGPSKRLDYEFEVGIFIGPGNDAPVPIAARRRAGVRLLPAERLVRARHPGVGVPAARPVPREELRDDDLAVDRDRRGARAVPHGVDRVEGDPQPLPYLDAPSVRDDGAFDIVLDASLSTAKSAEAGAAPMPLSRTSFRHAYWTVGQMVAHHTVNGCRLMPGDLFGSGTASGPTAGEAGALIEIVEGGKKPLALPNGETRTFLEDGDTVVLRAWCEKDGYRRIGFGVCAATILPAA